jgi:hypothetical protein
MSMGHATRARIRPDSLTMWRPVFTARFANFEATIRPSLIGSVYRRT